MMCSRRERTTRTECVGQTALQEPPRPHRLTPLEGPTWSPAVAVGFLGLIIVSAMAGIITLLSAIR